MAEDAAELMDHPDLDAVMDCANVGTCPSLHLCAPCLLRSSQVIVLRAARSFECALSAIICCAHSATDDYERRKHDARSPHGPHPSQSAVEQTKEPTYSGCDKHVSATQRHAAASMLSLPFASYPSSALLPFTALPRYLTQRRFCSSLSISYPIFYLLIFLPH